MDNLELIKLQIPENISVKKALKQMDQTGYKILFVINDHKKLIGVITDGDFRKWILAGRRLDADIRGVFNPLPVNFYEGYDVEDVKRVLVKGRFEAVPIVGKSGRVIDVIFWEDVFEDTYKKVKEKLDVPVAIMAGGRGSRFSTVTKILPKPLIPFGDKPVVEVIMDNFQSFGCKKFYLILGYKGTMIQSYFDNTDNGYYPDYVFEPTPMGTAGALGLLKKENFPKSFFVSNCDIVIKADYVDIYGFHQQNNYDITVVSAMRNFVIPYGVMEMTRDGKMKNIMEKPEYDFMVNTGMYVVKKDVLSLLTEEGKMDFTDLLKKVAEDGGKVGSYPVSEKSWIDIGQPGLWEENDSKINGTQPK